MSCPVNKRHSARLFDATHHAQCCEQGTSVLRFAQDGMTARTYDGNLWDGTPGGAGTWLKAPAHSPRTRAGRGIRFWCGESVGYPA